MELLPKPKCKKMNQVLLKRKIKKNIHGEGHQITPVLRVKQVAELQKIPSRMHQNSSYWEPKSFFFLGRRHSPLPRWGGRHPSPHPTLSAPSAPRSSCLRRLVLPHLCSCKLTLKKPRPIPIPHPTNMALFWHKITLCRFNHGGSYYCRGLKSEQGAEPPDPLALTTVSIRCPSRSHSR